MPFKDICLATLVACIWGVNFVAAKIGLAHLPPLFLMGLRFLLVALLLLPFTKKPDCSWKSLLFMAVTYGTAYHALLFIAVWLGIDIATSVIAVQLNVPFTSILGIWLLNDKLGWRRIIGMVVAFIGIVIIFGSPQVMQHLLPFGMIVGAAWFWALFNIRLKSLQVSSILGVLAWVSLYTTPMLLVLSLLFETPHWMLLKEIHFTDWISLSDWISLTYMALLSTVCGFGLWSWLLKRHPVNQVAPFSMLMPLFGVLAARLFLKDPLSWHTIIGGMVTLVGVGFIVIRRPQMTTKGATVN